MLTPVLALASIAFALVLARIVWKQMPFHPVAAFLVLAIVDMLFPAIYWSLFGQVDPPEWVNPLSADDILKGLVCYCVFFFVFIASLLAADGAARPPAPRTSAAGLPATLRHRLQVTLRVLLALTAVQIGSEMSAHGGVTEYFLSKLIFAAIDLGGEVPATGLFGTLPLRELLQAAIGVGFFYRKHLPRPWLYTWGLPLVAFALAASMLLRGAVLGCALTLLFAEVMRRRSLPQPTALDAGRRVAKSRLALLTVFAVVLSMYVYGSVRDSLRVLADDKESETATLAVPTFLTAGHGLLGVSHIVSKYGDSVAHVRGKTYIDMLLLPIPRVIYTSKPDWYGIDDITRGMGWPESTQSAVTMAGEAFANFGWFGLLVAFPLGALYGLLYRFVRAHQVRLLLLGPTLFFQVTTVMNWMSFTGFMNAVPLIVLLLALASYIAGGARRSRIRLASRPA